MNNIEKLNPNARSIFEDAYLRGCIDVKTELDKNVTIGQRLQEALEDYFKLEDDGTTDEQANGSISGTSN